MKLHATSKEIAAQIKEIQTKTPATVRPALETYRALFVNLRGMNYEGQNNQSKTIKNTTGADLEKIKTVLDNIAGAFKAMASTVKGQEAYLTKIAGLMSKNVTNNSRFELARKEAEAEAKKATPAPVAKAA